MFKVAYAPVILVVSAGEHLVAVPEAVVFALVATYDLAVAKADVAVSKLDFNDPAAVADVAEVTNPSK